MKEIKIYHSIWKNLMLVAICLAFVVLGVLQLLDGRNSFLIWASTLFFGIGGLFMLYIILRQRITNKPYYVITDECICMDSGMKKWEVRFADVEEFYLINVMSSKQIAIKYKKDVELQKMNEASSAGRTVRKFNEKIAGTQESLPADGFTMKPQQLCDLFNSKLTK